MAGRTMNLAHKGVRVLVCEGQDNTVEFRTGGAHITPAAKSFPAACKEATKWLLDNAGEMKGDYTR